MNKSIDQKFAFLLGWNYDNFFEPSCAIPGNTDFRCKGCKEIVPQWKREAHFNEHKTNQKMIHEAARIAANMNRELGGSEEIRTDICVTCGGEFTQERKRGRPRKVCYVCKPEE